MSTPLTVFAPDGVGEVRVGDDLVTLLLDALAGDWVLTDGDIVVVTSKVVSKSEGRVRPGTREDALGGETERIVARRGETAIVRNKLGLTMAAAGIDASNVEAGSVVLLPLDPDATARGIRAALAERMGTNVGVVITDTAGRAWREGQTDIAIGAAGIVVCEDYAGQADSYGNPLQVTAPAVADELAGAAELAQGKLAGRPFAVVRGRDDLVLAPDDDGTGAGALIRGEGMDFFGFGAREAVLRALAGAPGDQRVFGSPVSQAELLAALATLGIPATPTADTDAVPTDAVPTDADAVVADTDAVVADADSRLPALAFALGWRLTGSADSSRVMLTRHERR